MHEEREHVKIGDLVMFMSEEEQEDGFLGSSAYGDEAIIKVTKDQGIY
jgi:hypothetical protein